MTLFPGTRSRLTPRDLHHFAGPTLFDRIASAVCRADCLPRKELYEAWEVARRTRRRMRGGRVVDLACGHALTAQIMLILDDSSPSALAVDTRIPESAAPLAEELAKNWPRLQGRVEIQTGKLQHIKLEATDRVVSVHACGKLTDKVIDAAIAARAGVSVLPCCHSARLSGTGGLTGWMDEALAIDVVRAARLRNAGYDVHTQLISPDITPKNRLLLGRIPDSAIEAAEVE